MLKQCSSMPVLTVGILQWSQKAHSFLSLLPAYLFSLPQKHIKIKVIGTIKSITEACESNGMGWASEVPFGVQMAKAATATKRVTETTSHFWETQECGSLKLFPTKDVR